MESCPVLGICIRLIIANKDDIIHNNDKDYNITGVLVQEYYFQCGFKTD